MPSVGATGCTVAGNTVHLSCAYDTSRMNFTSYLEQQAVSGYTSNVRPAIFYKPCLDLVDNPSFGPLLFDNYVTQTKQHYAPHLPSDDTRPIPNVLNKSRHSGFHQLKSLRKTANLGGNTEYRRRFVPHPLRESVSQNIETLGPIGESGFTEGTNLHCNTFLEKNSCMVPPLHTRSSVTKKDFVTPLSFLQGPAAKQSDCSRHFSRETGFTRGAIAPLACPTSLLPSAQKSNEPTQKCIGKKEPTGSLVNAPSNATFPVAPFGRSHFNTHYRSTFCHGADYEESIAGRAYAGINNGERDNSFNRRDLDKFILTG